MVDVLIVVIVCFIAKWVTGIIRTYVLTKNLLDIPNERSSHAVPTPRGGGLSFVLVFLVTVELFFLSGKLEFYQFMILFTGGILIAGIGYIDDQGHVSAKLRLLVHFLVAIITLYFAGDLGSTVKIGEYLLPSWLLNILLVLCLVWSLNLFNFMDGIDGIAGVEAISVFGGTATIIYINNGNISESWLLFVLTGACLGFLFWNWPPAKIFMGDVGSGFLGYLIGVFTLLTVKSGLLSIWVWLILFGVFWIDATITLIRRFISGERVCEAHYFHAYQHAARKFKSHKKVTLAVLNINLFWLFPSALATTFFPEFSFVITALALTPIIVLAIKMGAGVTYLNS
ncbi:MAG: glycosyltransferase family 4 protein [Proteobacteria bacterium]|nr:glycosyltransferase family 4 protein [Pseudomonadota bacterium]MBU1738201.1 glycosyltransferase family 4 protein [Pseudomonadota bacterium]